MSDKENPFDSAESPRRLDNDEWSVARFERWVRVGVEAYVVEGVGAAAFPEAAHLILRTNSLMLGLQAFSKGLDATRRDNLKQAVARALSSLDPREHFVVVAEQLLAIAIAISAYPVLDVLPRKIGDGFFGQPDPEGRDSLFAMTLYAVARLATPGRDDAKRCLRHLIQSANFQPAHASTALVALCQVDPRRLAEHLSTPGLRDSLSKQFIQYDPDEIVQQRVAHEILNIVKIENFMDALRRLDLLDPSSAEARPDDWLINSLVFKPGAPLELIKSNGGIALRIRDESQIQVRLEPGSGRFSRRIIRPAMPESHLSLATAPIAELREESTARMAHLFWNSHRAWASVLRHDHPE